MKQHSKPDADMRQACEFYEMATRLIALADCTPGAVVASEWLEAEAQRDPKEAKQLLLAAELLRGGVLREQPRTLITAAEFMAKVGSSPVRDDLDRVNCPNSGAVGHSQCGWCWGHDKPRFLCGCLAKASP